MKNRVIFLLIIALSVACKKGQPLDNQSPETQLFVKEINLTGENRLPSQVRLYWSGQDIDGFVVGFEISQDNINWEFVTVQDSLFNFEIQPGQDSVDIDFWVRAVDNLDARDLSPAFLKVPIKNSPPTVALDTINLIGDTVYSVFSLNFSLSDPDGFETLDSVFIKINNGPWLGLKPLYNFVSVTGENPKATGTVNGKLFVGAGAVPLAKTLQGLVLEGNNRFYVKVRDQSGFVSETDSTKQFFLRNQKSDVLIMSSHLSANVPTPESIYFPIFNNVLGLGNWDYIDLLKNGGANMPAFILPTLKLYMNLYDKIFWYADESLYGVQHYFEACAGSIQEYMTDGGKILLSAKLPATFDNTSAIHAFSPMQSISTSVGQARILTNVAVYPVGPFSGFADTLYTSSFITGADPFYPDDSSNVVFKTTITPSGGWIGPNIISARTTNGTQTNQVFFPLELHKLNGDNAALEHFFDYVFNDQFSW